MAKMELNAFLAALSAGIKQGLKAMLDPAPVESPTPFGALHRALTKYAESQPDFAERLDAPGGDSAAFMRFIAAAHIYAQEKERLDFRRVKGDDGGVLFEYANADKSGESLGFLRVTASSTAVDREGDGQSLAVLEAGRLIARYRLAKGQSLFDDDHNRAAKSDRLLVDDWIESGKSGDGAAVYRKVFVIYLEDAEDRRKAAAGEFNGASDELLAFTREVVQ